jgi:hypothetical protein
MLIIFSLAACLTITAKLAQALAVMSLLFAVSTVHAQLVNGFFPER